MNARVGTAKRNERSGERGVVLLELVVSVGFMAALGAIVMSMLSIGWELNSRTRAVLAVATDSSTSTTWFVRDIHVATSTDVPDSGAPQATAQFVWTDSGGSHVCDFALSGSELQRTCDGETISISHNISNLSFLRAGDLVTISYDISTPDRPDISDSITLSVALGAG